MRKSKKKKEEREREKRVADGVQNYDWRGKMAKWL